MDRHDVNWSEWEAMARSGHVLGLELLARVVKFERLG